MKGRRRRKEWRTTDEATNEWDDTQTERMHGIIRDNDDVKTGDDAHPYVSSSILLFSKTQEAEPPLCIVE